MPDSKVGYGPDAPKLTEDQRRQFKRASYVRAPVPAPCALAACTKPAKQYEPGGRTRRWLSLPGIVACPPVADMLHPKVGLSTEAA